MQQRKLGQLGTSVSAVGYGAMSFTDFYGPATEEGSEAILKRCIDLGIDFGMTFGRSLRPRTCKMELSLKRGSCFNKIISFTTGTCFDATLTPTWCLTEVAMRLNIDENMDVCVDRKKH